MSIAWCSTSRDTLTGIISGSCSCQNVHDAELAMHWLAGSSQKARRLGKHRKQAKKNRRLTQSTYSYVLPNTTVRADVYTCRLFSRHQPKFHAMAVLSNVHNADMEVHWVSTSASQHTMPHGCMRSCRVRKGVDKRSLDCNMVWFAPTVLGQNSGNGAKC
jgi:hypothetical protein